METTPLEQSLRDARRRTLALIEGLDDAQLIGPKLATVNPLLWEIGHVAYFHELWTLRHLDGAASVLDNADALYDSINIHHDVRWDLPLLSRDDTLAYMDTVLEREIARLHRPGAPTEEDRYLTRYALYHEDMHTEAYTYTRQTLAYPRPGLESAGEVDREIPARGALPGDAEVPGHRFMLGARPEDGFCFDNEKWAHPVDVAAFSIARAAVSNEQFAAFVEAGGYEQQNWWDEEGWGWRMERKLLSPVYWRAGARGWEMRHFDQWRSLQPHGAVIHVSWHEARAWCRWAGRRLPSEAEWELAAAGQPGSTAKRLFPWGDTPPAPARANLDACAPGGIDVGALPDGDSAWGCRQMIGNVWEWTADTFQPYPGFVPDMYQDYSQPLFGITKVLRGGCWATRGRMLRNTWRTYYGADRNDVFAGFRSCAL